MLVPAARSAVAFPRATPVGAVLCRSMQNLCINCAYSLHKSDLALFNTNLLGMQLICFLGELGG